jgi:hypothetical protein
MDAPDISQVIQNYVTSIAIIVGGGWALWKWGFEEALRRKREIPSLDGKMSAITVTMSETKALVTLQAKWRNPGALPVKLDTKETSVEVYEVDPGAELGNLSGPDDLEAIYTCYPLDGLDDYILEPGTDSTMQRHFVLDKSRIYLIRWIIQQRPDKPSSPAYFWSRDLIWRYSEPSKRAPAPVKTSG